MILIIAVVMVNMIMMMIAMTAMMDVAIVTGNENVGKSVREYTNNNVKMLANRIEIVVSGKKDTVNGRRKD